MKEKETTITQDLTISRDGFQVVNI